MALQQQFPQEKLKLNTTFTNPKPLKLVHTCELKRLKMQKHSHEMDNITIRTELLKNMNPLKAISSDK